MKYEAQFKIECVEKYLAGEWAEQPEYSGTTRRRFRKMIVEWSRKYKKYGKEGLEYKPGRKWTSEERYELVKQVMEGKSTTNVALDGCVGVRQLNKWISKYKKYGYAGLQYKKDKQTEEPKLSKPKQKTELTKDEKEELRQLRRQNEYLRAENAYLKKLEALIAENEAEQSIKAKKQQQSNNSAKKDID